jgi:phenylpyruvate tautomerase PptA (4-oxalocrotonate tautomerase family)
MPVVYVNVWKGFGEKKSKTLIKGITNLTLPRSA